MTAPMQPVFVDPPSPTPQDVEWADTIAILIKRSGEWAQIFVGDYQEANRVATRMRKKRGGWAGHTWQASVRNTLSRTEATIYARHVKADDTPSDEGDEQ